MSLRLVACLALISLISMPIGSSNWETKAVVYLSVNGLDQEHQFDSEQIAQKAYDERGIILFWFDSDVPDSNVGGDDEMCDWLTVVLLQEYPYLDADTDIDCIVAQIMPGREPLSLA